MKKLMLASLSVLAAAAVQAATTWKVSLTTPDADGLTGVASLTNALTKAASEDTIEIGPGVYDLSGLTPTAVSSYAYTYLCAFNPAGGSPRQVRLTLKGANAKHWSEKTPEEETILRGGNAASIFYVHAGTGRGSSYFHLTFENGRRVKYAGTGSYGGGALTMAATEQCSLKNLKCIATNCVFRSCSSEYSGGATHGPDVYDSLYTNCSSTVSGGAARGFCNNNTTGPYNTNRFVKCVFKDCSAPYGGAIYGEMIDSLTDCTFVRCQAATNANTKTGGAVYAKTRMSKMSGCTFDSCKAGRGGAARFELGIDMIESCVFTNNFAAYDVGGAFFGDMPLGMIANSTFCDNMATNSGGGFYLGWKSSVDTITNCVFMRNSAATQFGGAFYFGKASGSLIDCVVTSNTAPSSGGAIYAQGLASLAGCTFIGNHTTPANGSGGCIYNGGNLEILTNCTFIGNESGWAGGGLYSTSIGSIADSTFVDNVASNSGGAVFATTLDSVTGSMFDGNTAVTSYGGAVRVTTLGSATDSTFKNNAANVGSGGVYIGEPCGSFTNCVFHANTNDVTVFGAHVNLAKDMVRCTFSGYGDVAAKNYDSCVFSNCVYKYTALAYGDDAHGLVTAPYTLGAMTMRNCLMRDCTASRFIATAGVRSDVANCTFVNNTCDDDNPTNTHAIMFFAFRGGSPTVPSTNVMVNCIFADNRHPNKKYDPCDAHFQGSVNPVGHTIVSNCLYKTYQLGNPNGGTAAFVAYNKGDPKFVAGDARYPDAPHYMILRTSAARGTGLWLDWMAGATDLTGTAMPASAPVDLGCYQYALPSFGGLLLVR